MAEKFKGEGAGKGDVRRDYNYKMYSSNYDHIFLPSRLVGLPIERAAAKCKELGVKYIDWMNSFPQEDGPILVFEYRQDYSNNTLYVSNAYWLE